MKVTAILGLLATTTIASELSSVAFYAKEKAHLVDFISANSDIDYGCRPVVVPTADEHKLHALLSQDQLQHFKRSLEASEVRLEKLDHINKRQAATAPIGKGDRFKGGELFPRGLGSQDASEYSALQSAGILNADEVYTAMKGLEKEYGMQLFTAPHKTFEGNTVIGGVANKAEKIRAEKQYIYLTSGIHARERGGPDNLIYFISDLLYANRHRKGLVYGNKTYTNSDVKRVLGAGIVFIPLTNPDGVRYDQATSSLWRKNRNPRSALPNNPASVGVDLNRNFDFLWNFTRYFDPSVSPASTDPASQAFYGTAPFSEPETRNMAWVYDAYPNIRWFIDVHSAAGTLLYSWGDDIDQFTKPEQNLYNSRFDGLRGPVRDKVYGEYISARDYEAVSRVANATTAAMESVGGREYISQQAVGLYPTSGASDDWSFGRSQVGGPGLSKVYGYTMEFGYPTNFYPTAEEFVRNVVDTNAGFMEFVLEASEVGLKG